jgi:hypothetical protein
VILCGLWTGADVLIVIRTPTGYPPGKPHPQLETRPRQVHLAHQNVTSLVTKLVTSN